MNVFAMKELDTIEFGTRDMQVFMTTYTNMIINTFPLLLIWPLDNKKCRTCNTIDAFMVMPTPIPIDTALLNSAGAQQRSDKLYKLAAFVILW